MSTIEKLDTIITSHYEEISFFYFLEKDILGIGLKSESYAKFYQKRSFIKTLVREFDLALQIYIVDKTSSLVKTSSIYDYSNLIFTHPVEIQKSLFPKEVNFNYSIFQQGLKLTDVVFEEKVTFWQCRFDWKRDTILTNTTFKKLVDMWDCKFHSAIFFAKCDFTEVAIFSESNFYSSITFKHCKTSSHSLISFENAVVHKFFDISMANFNCTLQFFQIHFRKPISQSYFLELKEYHNLRETFRIIKQAHLSQNNRIEALQFHSLEFNVYRKYLNKDFNVFKKFNSWTTVHFNWLSTNHGQSWFQGLLWILLISFFGFSFLFIKKEIPIPNSIEGYFIWFETILKGILPSLHEYSPYNKKIESKSLIYLFFLRILIATLIYQFVQAFRKFGRI